MAKTGKKRNKLKIEKMWDIEWFVAQRLMMILRELPTSKMRSHVATLVCKWSLQEWLNERLHKKA